MINEEDVEGLKSLGFKDEDIKKLLGMSKEQFSQLTKSNKPKLVRVPQRELPRRSIDDARRSACLVTYRTTCTTCHSTVEKTEQVTKLEYRHYHHSYKFSDMIANVKVDSCSECVKFLKTKSHDELIAIIMKQKSNPPEVKFPYNMEMDDAEQLELKLFNIHIKEYPLVTIEDHNRWVAQAFRAITYVHTMNTTSEVQS